MTRGSSWLPWTGYAYGWTARPRRPSRSPASGRCSMVPSATPWNSGCCPPTPSTWCAGPRDLAQIAQNQPGLEAFFGCLYDAALRPEEAVALRRDDLTLPAHGRGAITVTTACPRTGPRLDQHRDAT